MAFWPPVQQFGTRTANGTVNLSNVTSVPEELMRLMDKSGM